jgi:hypothetical protein
MIATFLDLTSSVFPFSFWISKFWRNFTQKHLAKLVEIHYTSKKNSKNSPVSFFVKKMAKFGPDKIIFIFIFILNCFLLIDDNHFGYKQKINPNIHLKTKHCNSGRRCRRLLSPFPTRLVRVSVQPSSSRSSRAE